MLYGATRSIPQIKDIAMMRCLMLPTALLLLGTGPNDAPKADPNEADLSAMQGEWKFTVQKHEGRAIEMDDGWRVVIKGKRLRYVFRGTTTAEYDLTLDASTSPKRHYFRAAGEREATKGIYRLEDATLSFCYDAGGDAFPKSLEQTGNHFYLEILKRN